MGAPRYPSGPRPGGVRMQGIGNEFNGVSIITNTILSFGCTPIIHYV